MSADFIALDIDRPEFAGSHSDPVAAVILMQPPTIDYSFVNGRCRVAAGRLTDIDLQDLARQVNAAALQLL